MHKDVRVLAGIGAATAAAYIIFVAAQSGGQFEVAHG